MASICKYRTKRGFAYRVESRPDKLFLRGFSYRPAAAIAKGHVERLFELHRAGRRPTGELADWVESLPNADRQKLVKSGAIDGGYFLESRPLAFHLLGFYRSLIGKGRGRRYVRQQVRRCVAICRGAKLRYFSDITVAKTEAFLIELRQSGGVAAAARHTKRPRHHGREGCGAQTFNHFVAAVKQFAAWMVASDRASINPLKNLKRLEAAKVREERIDYRGLDLEELEYLVAATDAGPERYGTQGSTRALVYWLASMTGFRASAINPDFPDGLIVMA